MSFGATVTKRALAIGLLIFSSACADGMGTALSYSALEIVPAEGDTGTLATGINALGEISGVRTSADGDHGFLVIGNAIVGVPPISGDAFSNIVGIDSLGDSAGTSSNAPGSVLSRTRPFLFRAGTSRLVALPPGDTQGVGTAIGPTGIVAGLSMNPPTTHLFTTQNGTATRIPFLTGDDTGACTGVNAAGIVVGWSNANGKTKHGFFFEPVANTVGLIGAVPGDFDTVPMAVNAKGLAVGYSVDTSGNFHSYFFNTGTGVLTRIASPGTDTHYRPTSINASGQIVGGRRNTVGQAVGQPHAYLLEAPTSTGPVDLNALLPPAITNVWTFYDAVGINDSGQIAANAIRADGAIHAFRLSPSNLGSGGQLGFAPDGGSPDGGSGDGGGN
jgi:probable HAF family extracellular repeat protein